jgi:acyl phosphate:glycerol-3-phosphate acyltransferase
VKDGMKLDLLVLLMGYLLGSIPFGYLLVKMTSGTDIRREGSGNIGATNVFRQSKLVGLLTFVFDAGKGYLAVVAAAWLGADVPWQALTAVAAILGHVFTFFLAFKGGKGVATGFGAFLALTPLSAGTTIIVFILTTALSRYVSLASIIATAAYPLWVLLYQEPAGILWPAMAGSAIIIAKHHQNIRRLIAGTEHRIGRGSNAEKR